jgi:hypothetical protein
MFEANFIDRNKTHIWCSVIFIFRKSCRLWDNVESIVERAGHSWQSGACALHAGYLRLQTHTGCAIPIALRYVTLRYTYTACFVFLTSDINMILVLYLQTFRIYYRVSYDIFFSMALRPNSGHYFLIHEVSRSHTTTHNTRYDSYGRVTSSSQRLLPDNTQHSEQTNIHTPAGFEPTAHQLPYYIPESN